MKKIEKLELGKFQSTQIENENLGNINGGGVGIEVSFTEYNTVLTCEDGDKETQDDREVSDMCITH